MCVDLMVTSSAYEVNCSSAGGMCNMYMLKYVGERTPPGEMPVLNWCCVDAVCYEFDNGVWDMCV